MDSTSEVFLNSLVICFIGGFIFSLTIGRMISEIIFEKEPETSIPAIILGWLCVFGMCLFFNEGSFSKISILFYPAFLLSGIIFYALVRLVGSK